MPTVAITDPADGDPLIPAQGAGKAIQLVSWDVTAEAAAEVSFLSGATVLWNTYGTGVVGGGVVVPPSPARLIQGEANTPITIGLSAAVGVRGSIDYNVVDVLT